MLVNNNGENCYNKRIGFNKVVGTKMLSAARRQFPKHPKVWLGGLVAAVLLLTPVATHAATLISQGFMSEGSLPAGSIVSLKKDSTDFVEGATANTSNNILGVVINTDSSQVSVTSGQKNQVQVATQGLESVLVSNINGDIAVGDPITGSPIGGVGMKATGNAKVVGIAQDSLPNSTSSKQTYKDKNGQEQSVMLGTVPVLVNVAYFYKQPDKTLLPAGVQNIANALAGKTVSTLPILICMGIFIVTLVVVVSIIYSMIHSSIISVGRNPMAQAAVYRNVIQLSTLVLVILGVSVVSIYLVLRRF
jgi:hypothetical protein